MIEDEDGSYFSPPELPDVRTRIVDDLTRPANMNLTVYAMHVAAGTQTPADPLERDPARQAVLLAGHEADRLRNAALYWVSPEMTRLCLAAAPGMPAFYPRPADLPAAHGFIYFARPIAGYEPGLITYSDGTEIRQGPRALPGRYQVCAASWGPWDCGGHWPRGGTWFTFYTRPPRQQLAALSGLGPEAARLAAGALPPLLIDNEAACAAMPPDHAGNALSEAVDDVSGTARWMHLVLCAFRLMDAARAARVTEQPVARPARRRAARAKVGAPGAAVRLVDVSAGGVRREVAGDRSAGTYQVRWIVSGHWRNQWYPATRVHRPAWIQPYVKGPADAPFKAPEVVHVFRRDG